MQLADVARQTNTFSLAGRPLAEASWPSPKGDDINSNSLSLSGQR